MIDEELLKPSRERLSRIQADITASVELAYRDIDHYGNGDREYANQRWREHELSVLPLRREMEGLLKVMTDYYGLQPMPSLIMEGDRGE